MKIKKKKKKDSEFLIHGNLISLKNKEVWSPWIFIHNHTKLFLIITIEFKVKEGKRQGWTGKSENKPVLLRGKSAGWVCNKGVWLSAVFSPMAFSSHFCEEPKWKKLNL